MTLLPGESIVSRTSTHSDFPVWNLRNSVIEPELPESGLRHLCSWLSLPEFEARFPVSPRIAA